MEQQTVGQRLRLKRLEYGYTITQVAAAIGVSKGNLSSYESDRNLPHAKTLVKLSSYFECSIDWILTGKEYSASSQDPSAATIISKDAEELLHYFSAFDSQDAAEIMLLSKAKYQKYVHESSSNSHSF